MHSWVSTMTVPAPYCDEGVSGAEGYITDIMKRRHHEIYLMIPEKPVRGEIKDDNPGIPSEKSNKETVQTFCGPGPVFV